MNRSHPDGSLTLDNASVQRLLDYGLLHYTDEGWYVGRWRVTWASDSDGTATAAANKDLPVPQDCQARAERHRP